MITKKIFGLLSVFPPENEKEINPAPEVQAGNIAFKAPLARRAAQFWDTSSSGSPYIKLNPYKQGNLLVDDGMGHAAMTLGFTSHYPADPTSNIIDVIDFAKFRSTKTVGTIFSYDPPRVFGSVWAHDQLLANTWMVSNTILSSNDVPTEYTQIGIVYQHPTVVGGSDISTATGASYITFANAHYLDNVFVETHGYGILQIGSGADAGEYFVNYVDFANNRLYLRNLDGSLFVGQATASSLPWYLGPGRKAFFNEVSILQSGTGLVVTGGTFRPEALRNSFILKVVFDKTGSDASAVGAEQQGSYYVTMLPYTSGLGLAFGGSTGQDQGRLSDTMLLLQAGSIGGVNFLNFFDGGVNGMVLDELNQRAWFGYNNTSGQAGIGCWRWKTIENIREIANHMGTAQQATYVTPSIVLGAGDCIAGMRIGPAGVVYTGILHASGGHAGLAIIKPDLTTLQYNVGSGFPDYRLGDIALDWSRARTGTANDVATTVSTDQVNSTSGAFTAADIGRVIVITGGTNNAGTYLIASVPSGTQVTVTTLVGGAVSFGSDGTGGTFQIGERIYLFFSNATTGASKINYMESLAPGSFLTRTAAMTNGASCYSVNGLNGGGQRASVDQANGNVYWLSNDTQYQVNKYDVAANSHTFRTIADVQAPTGGTGSIGTITLFSTVHVNSKFDEIWVGTNQGSVKLIKSTFAAGTAKRYFGDHTTTYANPAGYFRPQGAVTYPEVRTFIEHPDGRMAAISGGQDGNSTIASYSRANDLWVYKEQIYKNGTTSIGKYIVDSIGNAFYMQPTGWTSATSACVFGFGGTEVQYQWDNGNSRWIPLEVSPGALPNKSVTDTSNPGCLCKPIHSTLDPILYGVKLGFTKQGGATPPNNEFLGRMAQTSASLADGGTSTGTATFTGSGFVSGDVGKLVHIESGADAGVYKITVFGSSTSVTLRHLNGTALSAGATAGSLPYTRWSFGTFGANAGPETATVLLADGFGKDNTQDISGISYEAYGFKTLLQEQVEGTKFCVPNPIGVPGSTGMKVYLSQFPQVGSAGLASHDLQTTHARALPAEWTSGGLTGFKLVDGFVDCHADNVHGHGWLGFNAAPWWGVNPVSAVSGTCPMVDLGADAEVGYIIVRGIAASASYSPFNYQNTSHGLRATLYKANGPTTPVASSVSRTSGTTNLSLNVNNPTIVLTSGDFLGAITTGSFSNGTVTALGNTLTAPAATFVPGDVGKILKITAIGDIGAYRITAVDGTGAIVTVRSLDQTATAWLGSASLVVYEVRDGVREEDVICMPSIASPTQRLCVERLLSSTTAQVRVPPHTSVVSQNWQCAVPTWDKVKRISYSTEAVVPDVANNGTWVSEDGREQYNLNDWKIYADLTDLPAAQRTGRWWQMQMMPRFSGNHGYGADLRFSNFEFYSPAGARIGVSQNTFSDTALQNADFLSQHINRLDFIQSAYNAVPDTATFNGTVDLGGANGDTLTLTAGGNKFVGFQVGPSVSDGECVAGVGGNFNSATAAFVTSDVGRFLWVHAGVNAGIYRIATQAGTSVTLTLASGAAAPSFTGTTGEVFTTYEGIAAGGSAPDRIVFMDDLTKEYRINSINDAVDTLTLLDAQQLPVTGKQWEIRRPAFGSSSDTVDSTKTARLVIPNTTYPVQQGDVAHDSRGALRFWGDDIGPGDQRADGSVTGGDGVFVGSGFSRDDIGRLLYITTGVSTNQGVWTISAFTSATQVTVVNAYTGAAVSFTADAAADKVYQVVGDRRFKITKQVTTLRA